MWLRPRVEHLSVCVPAVPSHVAMYHKLRRQPIPMRTIVDDVSCEVRPGQLMAILGPSGSGKTSFLDAVALRYEDADVRTAVCSCVLLPAAWRCVDGNACWCAGLRAAQ